MGQYNFSRDGQITDLAGEEIGHIDQHGKLDLKDVDLMPDVLRDLRHQVIHDESFEWTLELLTAAKLPEITDLDSDLNLNSIIRLACMQCDTDEAAWVKEVPPGWEVCCEVQTTQKSLQPASEYHKHSETLEWYTHLGLCPDCREDSDD